MQTEKNTESILKNLNREVNELELSVRSKNCLREADIVYVSDLIQMTAKDLLGYRNFGVKSLKEIEGVLNELGLKLGMPPCMTELKSLYQTEMAVKLRAPSPPTEIKGPYQTILGVELMTPSLSAGLKDSYQNNSEKTDQDITLILLLNTEDLDLTVRANNCLKDASITYIGDLVTVPELELLKIRKLGRKSLAEIKKKLSMLGLNLGMKIQKWPHDDTQLVIKSYASELEEERMRLVELFDDESIKNKKGFNGIIRQANNLEEELSNLANLAGSDRNKKIIVKYFGWDGNGPKTLQAVGEELGLTRERIRQIYNKFEKKFRWAFSRKKIFLPCMEKVCNLVSEQLPAPAKQVESEIIAQNLTKNPFKLEGLIKTADFCRRKIAFRIEKIYGMRLVIPDGYINLTKCILRLAKKAADHWGVSTISDITSQAEEESAHQIDPSYVVAVLTTLKDFQWLDEASGWFWLTSASRNRLVNRIQKILSVADNIEISELRAGISRYRRMEGFAPPRRVLLEICRQLPWCKVEGNIIIADPPLDSQKILSGTERSISWILNKFGPVMTSQKLEETSLALGINTRTFFPTLSYSPIVTKHAPGIYGLRGARIPPGVVESLMRKKKTKARKVLVDYGWKDEGKIWFAYRLTHVMIRSGFFSLPAAMQKFLQGEFSLKAADNATIGSLKIKSCGWGLQPFYRRRGGEPEDYLILVFDLNLREVKAYVGDIDLLDDFQSNIVNF